MRLPFYEHKHRFENIPDNLITTAIDKWKDKENKVLRGKNSQLIASLFSCPAIFIRERDSLKADTGDIVMDFNHLFYMEWSLEGGTEIRPGIYYEVQPAACKDTLFGTKKVPYKGWYSSDDLVDAISDGVSTHLLYSFYPRIRNCFLSQQLNGMKSCSVNQYSRA